MTFRLFVSISLLLFLTLISVQHPLSKAMPDISREAHAYLQAAAYNDKGDSPRDDKPTAINLIDRGIGPAILTLGNAERRAEEGNTRLETERGSDGDRNQYYRPFNEDAKDFPPDVSLQQDNEKGQEHVIANDLSGSKKLDVANSLILNRLARDSPKDVINHSTDQKGSIGDKIQSFDPSSLNGARRVRTTSEERELTGTHHFSEKTREAMRKMNPLTIGDQVAQMIHARKCGSKCKSVGKSPLEASVAVHGDEQPSLSDSGDMNPKQHSQGTCQHGSGKGYGFSVIILAGDPLKVKASEGGKCKFHSVIDGKSHLDDSITNGKQDELSAGVSEVKNTPRVDKSYVNGMKYENGADKSGSISEAEGTIAIDKSNVNNVKDKSSQPKSELQSKANTAPEVDKSNVNSVKDKLSTGKGELRNEIDSFPQEELSNVNNVKDESSQPKSELQSKASSAHEVEKSNVNSVKDELSTGKGELRNEIDGFPQEELSNENNVKDESSQPKSEIQSKANSAPEVDKSNVNSVKDELGTGKSELINEIDSFPQEEKYNVNSMKDELSSRKSKLKTKINNAPKGDKHNENNIKGELTVVVSDLKSEVDSMPAVEDYKLNGKKDEKYAGKPDLKSIDDNRVEEDPSDVNSMNNEFSAGNPELENTNINNSELDKSMVNGVQDKFIFGKRKFKSIGARKTDSDNLKPYGKRNKYQIGLSEYQSEGRDKYYVRDSNKNSIKDDVNSGGKHFKSITNRKNNLENSNYIRYLDRPELKILTGKTSGRFYLANSNSHDLKDEVRREKSKVSGNAKSMYHIENTIGNGRKYKVPRGQSQFTAKNDDESHFDQSFAGGLRDEIQSNEVKRYGKTKGAPRIGNSYAKGVKCDDHEGQSRLKFSEETEADSHFDTPNAIGIKEEVHEGQHQFSGKAQEMSQFDDLKEDYVKDEIRAKQNQPIRGPENKYKLTGLNVNQKRDEFRIEKNPNAKIEFPIYDQDLVSVPDPFHGLLEQKYWATPESSQNKLPIKEDMEFIHPHRIRARGIPDREKNEKVDKGFINGGSPDERDVLYRVISNALNIEDGMKDKKKGSEKDNMAAQNRVLSNAFDRKDDNKGRIKSWKKSNRDDHKHNNREVSKAEDNKHNEESGKKSFKKGNRASDTDGDSVNYDDSDDSDYDDSNYNLDEGDGSIQCSNPDNINKTSNGTCRSWKDVSNNTEIDNEPSPLEPFSDIDVGKNESCCISWNDISPNYCEVKTNATSVCLPPTEEVTPGCGDDGNHDVEEFEDFGKENLNGTCCKSWKEPDNESNTMTPVTTANASS